MRLLAGYQQSAAMPISVGEQACTKVHVNGERSQLFDTGHVSLFRCRNLAEKLLSADRKSVV